MVRTNTRRAARCRRCRSRAAKRHAAARSHFRPTATAAGARSILTPARCMPSPKPPAMWPLSARALGLPPIASTSAIPKNRKSCGNSARLSMAWPKPAAHWPSPSPAATSASITIRWANPSTRRLSSVSSACWKMPRAPLTMGFRAEGDLILLLDGRGDVSRPAATSAPTAPPATPRSSANASRSKPGQSIRSLHEFAVLRIRAHDSAGLIPAETRRRPSTLRRGSTPDRSACRPGERSASLTSAHDLSDGGLAVALAECGFASEGLAADVSTRRRRSRGTRLIWRSRGTRCGHQRRKARLPMFAPCGKIWRRRACPWAASPAATFHLRYNGVTVIQRCPRHLRTIWTSALQHALADKLRAVAIGKRDPARSVLGENASN